MDVKQVKQMSVVEQNEISQVSIIELGLDRIRLNPYQPRKFFNEDKLDELAESIRQNGIIEPIIVRPVDGGVYELVAGERRFRASIRAGMKNILAVSRPMDDKQSLELALIENIQREDIKPIECAQAYRRLMDEFGLTQEMVADKVGKKRSTVANTLRLLNLPQQILGSLDREEITEGHARALLSIENESVQSLVWEEITKRGLSVRETEWLSRNPGAIKQSRASNVSRATKNKVLGPDLSAVEDKLRRFLGTKVTISRQHGPGGKIEIEYYDDEDLMRLLDLMSQM